MCRYFVRFVNGIHYIFQHNFSEVGILNSLDEVTCIVCAARNHNAGEQRPQPGDCERNADEGIHIHARRKAYEDSNQDGRHLRGKGSVLLVLQHFNNSLHILDERLNSDRQYKNKYDCLHKLPPK